jgi:copper chaperone CopZ
MLPSAFVLLLTQFLKMKKVSYLFLFIFALSCSSEPEVVHLRTVKGPRKEKTAVNANQLMTIQVEGMTCEMGCGGSIRKALKATGAVERVSFDFVEGRKIQQATIYLDSSKVSSAELEKIIRTINEKQFKTYQRSTEALTASATTSNSPSSEKKKVEMNEELIAVPNLLDLLTGFVL